MTFMFLKVFTTNSKLELSAELCTIFTQTLSRASLYLHVLPCSLLSIWQSHTISVRSDPRESSSTPSPCLLLFYKGKNMSPHREDSHYKMLPLLSDLFKLFKDQNIMFNIVNWAYIKNLSDSKQVAQNYTIPKSVSQVTSRAVTRSLHPYLRHSHIRGLNLPFKHSHSRINIPSNTTKCFLETIFRIKSTAQNELFSYCSYNTVIISTDVLQLIQWSRLLCVTLSLLFTVLPSDMTSANYQVITSCFSLG